MDENSKLCIVHWTLDINASLWRFPCGSAKQVACAHTASTTQKQTYKYMQYIQYIYTIQRCTKSHLGFAWLCSVYLGQPRPVHLRALHTCNQWCQVSTQNKHEWKRIKSTFLNKRELSKLSPNFPSSLRNGPALSFSFSNCGSVIRTYHPAWFILSCLATSFTAGWNDIASPMMRSCPMWANLGEIRSQSMD